jgi:hypothetical protein
MPCSTAARARSGHCHRDSGRPELAGSSHASALIATTTSGGLSRGDVRPSADHPARPDASRRTVCATWTPPAVGCRAGQRYGRCVAPRQPSTRSWPARPAHTMTYTGGHVPPARRAPGQTARSGTGWCVASTFTVSTAAPRSTRERPSRGPARHMREGLASTHAPTTLPAPQPPEPPNPARAVINLDDAPTPLHGQRGWRSGGRPARPLRGRYPAPVQLVAQRNDRLAGQDALDNSPTAGPSTGSILHTVRPACPTPGGSQKAVSPKLGANPARLARGASA